MMFNKSVRVGFYAVLFNLLGGILGAQAETGLSQAIDEALNKSCLDLQRTGVSVVALPSGKSIYEHNVDTPLLPASVMKLVTTGAALHYLGPEYRFRTSILYTGQRTGETINGDLIIQGGGDPKLSPQTLWQIASQLKKSGISQVNGRLLVDTQFFDDYDRSPTWEPDTDLQRAYNAKIGALSVGYNIVAVHLQPGTGVGEPLNVWLEPAPAYMSIQNNGKTVGRGRNSVSAHRQAEDVNGQVQITVGGTLRAGAGEHIIYVNVDNPTHYTAETFRSYLEQVGIRVAGTTEKRFLPANAKLLYQHESPPLALILKELNTYSNNFIAEQVIKTISATRFGTPGSHADAARLVKQFLELSGIQAQGIVIADGSGLSKQNNFTARAMSGLLTTMMQRFDIGPDFMSVLRVMGAEGAPSKRLVSSPMRARVRAKTGTLNGVSALAGYVASTNERVYAFALFLNNNRCGGGAKEVENRIVEAIYNLADEVQPIQYSLSTTR